MVNAAKIIKDKIETWPQVLAIFFASLVAILSGILFAWPSPFIRKITQDERYNITEYQASWFTVIQPLGMCLSSPFFVYVTNTIGRKKTIFLASVPLVASLMIKAFATSLWLLYFSRFCAGIGDAIVFSSVPAYIGEVAIPKIRGVWGNLLVVCLFFGQFIVNVVGSYCTIQATSLIFLVIPAIFWLSFSFMPESPYFYIMVGKYEESKRSLRMLRRKLDVEKEFEAIKCSVEIQMKESGTWKDLLTTKTNRKALKAGLFLRMSQPLCGIYAFISYTQLIFEKAGGNISPQTSAILQTGLTMFMYACSSFGSDLLGRRKAYMLSVILGGVVLFVEATFFYIDINVPGVSLESIRWFPLAGMLSFVIVSSFGIGIIPNLMTTEIFATSVKAQGISAVTVAFALTTLVVNYGFYYLDATAGGIYGPFFLFGCFNILSLITAYFVMPETTGKTLEEIQETLKNM